MSWLSWFVFYDCVCVMIDLWFPSGLNEMNTVYFGEMIGCLAFHYWVWRNDKVELIFYKSVWWNNNTGSCLTTELMR